MVANGGMNADRSHINQRLAGQNLKNEEKKQKAADFLMDVFTGVGSRVSNDAKKKEIAQHIGDALGKGLYTYLNLTQWQPKDTSTIVDSVVDYISKQAHRHTYTIDKISIQKLIDAHEKSSRAAKNKLQRQSLDDPTAAPELLSETEHLSLMKLYTKNHFKQETKELGHCIGDDEGDTFAHVCEKTLSGEMEVFAIRMKDPDITKYPQGKPYWTIEYATDTHEIKQIKTYSNKLLTRSHQHYNEILQMIGEIIVQRKVNVKNIADIENITENIEQNRFVTTRGELTAKELFPSDIIIAHMNYVATKGATREEIDAISKIRDISVDLTDLPKKLKKTLLEMVSENILDKCTDGVYSKLEKVGGYMQIGGVVQMDITERFPALEKVKGIVCDNGSFVQNKIGELERFDEKKYLQYASKPAKEYFQTLSVIEKIELKDIVEYTQDSINFTVQLDGKRMVIPFAKENLTHPDIGEAENEKVKTETVMVHGESIKETYFEWDYLNSEYLKKGTEQKGYTETSIGLIPQDSIYEAIMKAMPSGDYTKGNLCTAGKQVYGLLGGVMSGFRSAGSAGGIDSSGYLWSASAGSTRLARAVRSNTTEGTLANFPRKALFPVRALKTPPREA